MAPPRQPSDHFTRFTSTSPHASSKPSSSPSSFSYQPPNRSAPSKNSTPSSPSSSSSSSLPNVSETPKEKVARLRAAARAAKSHSQMSPLDRIIDRGRIWADVSHRVAAYGLIGLTGIAVAVSLYGLTSLVVHNRRQKRAWIDREMQRLGDAHAAFQRSEASPEQLHLLEQERAGMEIELQKGRQKQIRKEEGLWGRLKGLTGTIGGSKGEEDSPTTKTSDNTAPKSSERLLEEGWVEGEIAAATSTIPTTIKSGVSDAVRGFEESRRQGEKQIQAVTGLRGGQLDVLAANMADALAPKKDRSWLSWVKGGDES